MAFTKLTSGVLVEAADCVRCGLTIPAGEEATGVEFFKWKGDPEPDYCGTDYFHPVCYNEEAA